MGINENQKLNSDRIQANLGLCLQKPYVEKAICKYMNTPFVESFRIRNKKHTRLKRLQN